MTAPNEFRIWRSGANPTDHGVHFFTERSAALLMQEQAARGNLYSIDVDHLSLSKDAPVESRKAVGWHRLEVRGEELWAVQVQWTDTVRAGLEKSPPEWRYFSPAYDVDEQTGEIISYLNTALTNNPATWSVTALSTKTRLACLQIGSKVNTMATKADALKAYLKTMAEDDDEGVSSKAKAALAALDAMDPPEHKEPDGDEPKSDAKAAEDEPEKKAGEDDADKKATKAAEDDADKKAAEDDADKKARKAASRVVADLDAQLEAVKSELATYRKEREETEKRALIASRSMSKELATKLSKQPLSIVRELTSALPPKPTKDFAAAEKVQATRGAETSMIAAQPGAFDDLDRRMGIVRPGPAINEQKCVRTYRPMGRDEAKRVFASLTAEKEPVK